MLRSFSLFCLFSFFISGAASAQNMRVKQYPLDEEISEAVERPERKPQKFAKVRLQGLDKITARRERFDADMGIVTRFGNLEIIPRACWKAPPSERPETAALLEIWYWKPGEKPARQFNGWMFASSPALSSLKHPVYDITVLDCLKEPVEEAAAEKTIETEDATLENSQ